MEITCRKQDQKKFEDLGFTAQDWDSLPPDSALVVMVDEEANYAHCGELPSDIPYRGINGAGGEYGHGAFACDGRRFAELEIGHDGGFVIEWDESTRRPLAQSLKSIRRYLAVRKNVQAMFPALSKPENQLVT